MCHRNLLGGSYSTSSMFTGAADRNGHICCMDRVPGPIGPGVSLAAATTTECRGGSCRGSAKQSNTTWGGRPMIVVPVVAATTQPPSLEVGARRRPVSNPTVAATYNSKIAGSNGSKATAPGTPAMS